jgi:hypothetical protein
MHHIWKKGPIALVTGTYTATITNKKTHSVVTIKLPQSGFFADGSDLTQTDAEDIITGMVSILNMTASP